MKDRLLTTDEIKKYHWIYISPASIETTIAILEEQDKKSIAANNAKWREILNSLDVHENELGYIEISNHVEYAYYKNLLSEMGKEGE
jgi:hypothetical protein